VFRQHVTLKYWYPRRSQSGWTPKTKLNNKIQKFVYLIWAHWSSLSILRIAMRQPCNKCILFFQMRFGLQ